MNLYFAVDMGIASTRSLSLVYLYYLHFGLAIYYFQQQTLTRNDCKHAGQILNQ